MLIVKHVNCRENLEKRKQVKKSKVHSFASNNLLGVLETWSDRPRDVNINVTSPFFFCRCSKNIFL